jgi:hypothetical protein
MLNITLIAAPAPNKEQINSSQGLVPNKPSKYLPSKTPINIDAAIVTPICEKWVKARNVSLYLDCLPLLCLSSKTDPSSLKEILVAHVIPNLHEHKFELILNHIININIVSSSSVYIPLSTSRFKSFVTNCY